MLAYKKAKTTLIIAVRAKSIIWSPTTSFNSHEKHFPAEHRLLWSVLALRRHPGRLHVLHHLRRSGDSREVSGGDREVLHRKDSSDRRRVGPGLAAGVGQLPSRLKLGQHQADAVTNLLISIGLSCPSCIFELSLSISQIISLSYTKTHNLSFYHNLKWLQKPLFLRFTL